MSAHRVIMPSAISSCSARPAAAAAIGRSRDDIPFVACLLMAALRQANAPRGCPFVGVDRKWSRPGQNDAIDRAPRGRELSVREDLTRIIVDWSGSWQAARPGNWLGRSPATKAALGR
jgi:hypothetical protein